MTRSFAVPAALALLGMLLSSGCSERLAVAYVQPAREDLVSYVTTNGRVEAGERSEVFAATTGTVTQIAAQEGRPVRRGDRLLSIDDRAAREELSRAQAQLDAARAELQGVEQGGSPAEIADLENELATAQTSRQQLEEDVQSLERLVQKQAAPRTDLDTARQQLKQTTAKIDLLQKKLAGRVAPHDKEHAEARVREVEAAVALAKQKVGSAAVEAPIEGVVYSLAVRPGAFVTPGMLLARLGKLGEVELVIYVDEPELGRVTLDAPARITSDAYPGKQWECRTSRLPTEVVSLENRRVGEVRCTVANAEGLIPNLTVNVAIESAAVKNALTLPREAVFRDGDQSYVWVANGSSQAERRPVELGIASASRVEISSGVSESDRVLLPGQQSLTAGQTVQLAEVGRGAP